MNEKQISPRQVDLSDINVTMQSGSGRSFIKRILSEAGLHNPTFVNGDDDETKRRSILRDFALWIEAEIKEASPNMHLTLLKEMHEDGN